MFRKVFIKTYILYCNIIVYFIICKALLDYTGDTTRLLLGV